MDAITDYWPYFLPRKVSINEFSLFFKMGSSLTLSTVGTLAKIWAKLNNFDIYNRSVFLDAITLSNQSHVPLISLSNHNSLLDDPVLWGAIMPWSWIVFPSFYRWSLAAYDICFTNPFYSTFFSLGKTFPIIRGKGIYQTGMDFAIDLLKQQQFIHIFPQGKIIIEPDLWDTSIMRSGDYTRLTLSSSDSSKHYHFKWGVGRLIMEALKTLNEIFVLPFYHIGMDKILSLSSPYSPRINQNVTIYIRDKLIRFDASIFDGKNKSEDEIRINIIKYLEDEMKKIKLKTMIKHFEVFGKNDPKYNM